MNPGFGLMLTGALILMLLNNKVSEICGAILCLSGIVIYFLYEYFKRKELEHDVKGEKDE